MEAARVIVGETVMTYNFDFLTVKVITPSFLLEELLLDALDGRLSRF